VTSTATSTPDLVLHGARSGNCLRAAIGLNEAGLAWRSHHVDLRAGEQRGEAHLALNPAGQVPVLVVQQAGDTPPLVLSQSNAILFYAAEHSRGRLLAPEGSRSRYKALEAFFYFTSDVIAQNGIAFHLQGQGYADAAAVLANRYLKAIGHSERFLSEAGFMGGDAFSLADIVGYTIVKAVERHLPWSRLEPLAAWFARIAARPAVQAGMTAFDVKSGVT
jgi:GSH-dependent disulfide-bond oxidoreductase